MDSITISEKIAWLKQSDLCHSLQESEFEILADKMSVSNFSKGETILKQGALVSNAVLVLEGSVKKFMELPTGKKRIIEIFGPVKFSSLLFVMDAPSPCIYSMSALVDSKIGFIDIGTIKKMIMKNGKFGLDIILYNTAVFKGLAMDLFSLNTKQMTARVADVLLDFARTSDIFDLPITQVDMSQIIGITPENLSNILKKFRNDHVISVDGKSITIHNRELLKKISSAG